MKYFVTSEEKEYTFDLKEENGEKKFLLNEKPMTVDFKQVGKKPVYSLLVDGKPYDVWAESQNGHYTVAVNGQFYRVKVENERSRLLKQLTRGAESAEGVVLLKAPMPGLVVRVKAEKGARVKKGQGLVLIEAMKMENEIKSPVNGVIGSIAVKQGEAIDKNAVLLEINAE
ncbi:2-oxoglutarate carboxylase large subunit [bacterium BMS3Abin05]|nr:2-oxoglutarate carboxylase large subunit [bacterium BMS3Abin05]GBE27523.1 2-oxoglutarate carboxylase large subunit [bacterium BMS3Bbin03]